MTDETHAHHLAAFGKKRAARITVKMGAGVFAALFVSAIVAGVGIYYVATRGLSAAGGGGVQGPCGATGSFILTGSVLDANTKSQLGATTTADIVVPSQNNYPSGTLSAPQESPTQSSGTFSSVIKYPACVQFYIFAHSTAGNKYYDTVFGPYTTGQYPVVQSSCGSNQQCWALPALGMYQESTGANVKFATFDSLGASCQTATGAASAAALTTHQAGNAGAVTTYLTMTIAIAGSTATSVTNFGVPVAYGTPAGGIASALGGNIQPLSLTVFYAVNSSKMASWIQQNGWTLSTIQLQPTVGQLFFKTFSAMYGSKTSGPAAVTIQLPIDLTTFATGKHVQAVVFPSDMQLGTDSPNAITDGSPSAFGAASTMGAVTLTQSPYTISAASGLWTGDALGCSVTV